MTKSFGPFEKKVYHWQQVQISSFNCQLMITKHIYTKKQTWHPPQALWSYSFPQINYATVWDVQTPLEP